jgi:hypothetical protein
VTDLDFDVLAALPPADPDGARGDRVRAACHAALRRSRRRPQPRSSRRVRAWGPLLTALSGVYLAESIRLALYFLGVR